MKSILRFLLAICLVQTAAAGEYTMSSAVKYALANNRELHASYLAVEQARGRLIQAGKWPNPELEFAFASDAPFRNEGETALTAGLMQPIPYSGRLRLAKNVQRVEVAKAIASIREKERLIIGDTQRAFLTALAIQERLESIQAAAGVSQKDVELVRQLVASGKSNVAEVSRANVAALRFRQNAATLGAELNTALLDLKLLMGMSVENSIRLKGSLGGAAARLQKPARAVAIRPDLTLKQLDQDSARAEAALAKAEAWEDIQIGVEYDYGYTMDEPEGLDREEMIGFRVTVPLPLWNRNQGRVIEQRASESRAAAEASALRLQIDKETLSARLRAANYREALRLFEQETEPSLREAEQQFEASYASGTGELRDILTVRSQHAELRADYLATYLEYVLALNELETALGANPYLPLGYLKDSDQ